MTTPKTILSRILFFLYLAVVAFLCFMHTDKMPEMQKTLLGIPMDKIAHFLMFLPFPILTYLAYDHVTNKFWHAFFFALGTFVIGSLIAYGTEFIQGRLPYRTMDIADFKADAIAILLSSIFVFIIDVTHLKVRKN